MIVMSSLLSLHSDDEDVYEAVERSDTSTAPAPHAVSAPIAPRVALPVYLAPGNGVSVLTDAADTVRLVARVDRLDLQDEPMWPCHACGDAFTSALMLEVRPLVMLCLETFVCH